MDNILNLVIVMGLLLIGSGLGLFVLHLTRLRASDGLQHVLLATGVGLGVVSFVPFGLAWTQQLSSLNLILAASVLVVTGLMAWRLFMPITLDELRLIKSRIYNLSRLDLVLILLISVLAILNLFAALAPVTGVDELVADDYNEIGQWSGLRYIKKGGFQLVHSDARLHPHLNLEKRFTVVGYLNKDWTPEDTGYL